MKKHKKYSVSANGKCVACHIKDVRYYSKGLCISCYMKARRYESPVQRLGKWKQIENHYNKPKLEIIRELFVDRQFTGSQIIEEIKSKTKINLSKISTKDVIDNIKDEYTSRLKLAGILIIALYKMTSVKDFIGEFYFKRAMSVEAIQERILKDTKIQITRQALWGWINGCGLSARRLRDAFNLAVSKKRFSHKAVAKKIDYANREINYYDHQEKRLKTMASYSHNRSAFAIGLKKMLLNKRITTKELADHLNVTHGCIKGWCALNNRVNEIYWKQISDYLKVDISEILDAPLTASQKTKLENKDNEIISDYSDIISDDDISNYAQMTKYGCNMITINKKLFEEVCQRKGLTEENRYNQLAGILGISKQYIKMLVEGRIGVSADFIDRYLKYIGEHKSNDWSRFFIIKDNS